MNQNIIDAISDIDEDLIDAYFKTDEKLRKAKKRKSTYIKWSAAAAACLVLALLAAVIPQYIPAELPVDYEVYFFAGAVETGGTYGENIPKENVWVYYAKDGKIWRERVRLPQGAQNAFIAWKHLNGIGDEVKLITYSTGGGSVLDITLSEPLPQGNDLLVPSLEKTMCAYFGTEFDEINILIYKK